MNGLKPKTRIVYRLFSSLAFAGLVFAALPPCANATVKDDLAARFVNRAVFIRGFFSDDDLTFDSQGSPVGHPISGPWSLALFQVQKLKIDKHQIRFEGFRAASVFDPETGKFKSVPLKKLERLRVTINADTTSESADALNQLVDRVLTTRLTAADVPQYWRAFFDGKASHYQPGREYVGAIPGEQMEGDPVYSVRGPSGMSPPRVKIKQEPSYSEEARTSHIQGTTVIEVIVDKAGVPRNLQVVRAIGFGLDDEAVKTAQQWRFDPALLNGSPVAVQISIEIQFRLF